MAFQKAVQKEGWLVVFLGFPPPFFAQGVSTILACVFPHPVDLGQGGICQEGKQLPKAVTRVQSSLVQFGIVGLLLISVFWALIFPPLFGILFLLYFFITAAAEFALCHGTVAMYKGDAKYLFLRWQLSDIS